MIINIRGTSGSGKTYAAREVMQLWSQWGMPQQIVGGDSRPKANVVYMGMVPAFVLGKYEGPVCGGCDNIKTQDEICALVRHFSQFGHVIFEGVVVGTIFDRYMRLDQELSEHGIPYVWAYLDTPLETCLERVMQRRADRGDKRPFNPTSTENKYRATWSTHDKAIEAGLDVRILPYDQPVGETLISWMTSDIVYDYTNSWRKM